MMLQSVINAVPKVCLMMNVPKSNLDAVVDMLPSENPTISDLAKGDWVDVMAVVNKLNLRDLLPKLKEHGARSIVELPVSKIIE